LNQDARVLASAARKKKKKKTLLGLVIPRRAKTHLRVLFTTRIGGGPVFLFASSQTSPPQAMDCGGAWTPPFVGLSFFEERA